GGRGWVLVDAGDGPPVERGAGASALDAAQAAALERGLAAEAAALEAVAASGAARVDVRLALRSTSLPRSVRERAAAALAPSATLADVVVALADVAGSCDREEGETYARAAGRLVLASRDVAS